MLFSILMWIFRMDGFLLLFAAIFLIECLSMALFFIFTLMTFLLLAIVSCFDGESSSSSRVSECCNCWKSRRIFRNFSNRFTYLRLKKECGMRLKIMMEQNWVIFTNNKENLQKLMLEIKEHYNEDFSKTSPYLKIIVRLNKYFLQHCSFILNAIKLMQGSKHYADTKNWANDEWCYCNNDDWLHHPKTFNEKLKICNWH